MFEEIKDIKSGRKELREFGLTVGIILVILGVLVLWRGRVEARGLCPYFFGWGALLVVLGLVLPRVLKPLQKIWMGLAVILGFFVSRIVLSVLFYTVLTPIGLLVRLLGKDVLNQRIERNSRSYWHERESGIKDKKSYENQY